MAVSFTWSISFLNSSSFKRPFSLVFAFMPVGHKGQPKLHEFVGSIIIL